MAHAAPVLVLDADDEIVARRGRSSRAEPAHRVVLARSKRPSLREHLASGGGAALFEDGELVLRGGGESTVVARAEEVPITLGGTAMHNVRNALAACALARELGIDAAGGLLAFGTPRREPRALRGLRRSGGRASRRLRTTRTAPSRSTRRERWTASACSS
ncbi:MAG: hypothetical protein R3F34_05975 [Planctomycetota bacterium]